MTQGAEEEGTSRPLATSLRWPRVLALSVLSIACLWFFVWPAAMLVVGAFRTQAPGLPGGGWGLDAFRETFGDAETYSTILSSTIFAVASAVGATLIGCAMAFLSTRSDVPLRRVITPTMFTVLLTPPLFFAFSWALLGNERAGLINVAYRGVTSSEGAIVDIYSMGGMVMVTVLKATAFGYFLLLAPFSMMNRSLEEASLIAGASRWQTFTRVDVPVLAPTVLGVFILQLILGFEAFDIPLLLGLPADVRVFSSHIYRYLSAESPPGYPQAAALALLLLGLIVILVAAERRMLHGRSFVTVTGKAAGGDRWELGRLTPIATLGIAAYVLLALVLPLTQIVLGSLQPTFGVNGNLTFEHYASVLSSPDTVRAMRTTFLMAGMCGFLAVAFSLWLAATRRRWPSRVTGTLQLTTWIPWALPGVMLALAVAWSYLTIPALRTLYGTTWMLATALIVAAVPVAARSVDGALAMVAPELEEASAVAGVGAARTFVDILVPLIARSLLGAWLICGVLVAGRLDVPLILNVSGNETVSVLAYQMYTQGNSSEAAALLIVTCLAFAAPFVLVSATRAILRRRTVGRRRATDEPQQTAAVPQPAAAFESTARPLVTGDVHAPNRGAAE